MTKEQINKMDRVDLIVATQCFIKDPAIKAENLSTFTLRNILMDIYAKGTSDEEKTE